MQKHYLISSLIKQSNDVQPQQINNTPEPNKKVYKDYDSVRKLVLDDKPNNLTKKNIK
jgi:hypothetical protein